MESEAGTSTGHVGEEVTTEGNKFFSLMKTNFENPDVWLHYGLSLSLSKESPHEALQAFVECMRVDTCDPLPAMLAAKVLLEDLDNPERGLDIVNEAVQRCQKILQNDQSVNNNKNSERPSKSKHTGCKNIPPLLSRCYLLASIMHALIYEREPESIKQFKASNLKSSLHNIDLAIETCSSDYLPYFHRALHRARQKSYLLALEDLRTAIKLNPYHVPSMQLLILSLSALKHYEEALDLCESTLHEHQDNLLLLYIKCNLEQCLVETKGYKTALNTAQHMLKCLRRIPSSSSSSISSTINEIAKTVGSTAQHTAETISAVKLATPVATQSKQFINLFAEDSSDSNEHNELTTWLLIAEIFLKIGSVDDAELCVDDGSLHTSGALSHQVMFTRGLISKARNNLIEARAYFQSCLALSPKHARALQQLAHVHYLQGNHSTAEKFLKDSLDLDNDSYKTWHYLSLVYIEQNQHDRANECVKKATTLEDSSPIISLSSIKRLTLL